MVSSSVVPVTNGSAYIYSYSEYKKWKKNLVRDGKLQVYFTELRKLIFMQAFDFFALEFNFY